MPPANTRVWPVIVLERSGQAEGQGGLGSGVVGMSGFAKHGGGGANQHRIPPTLSGGKLQEFPQAKKCRGQDTVEGLAPLLQ